MAGQFEIKNLFESYEIQKSYDNEEYLDAVLRCRVYLESWLGEYIFVLLFPSKDESNEQNRQFVRERFLDMFYQISWLKEKKYISENDFINLDKIRLFCDKVIRRGEVFSVVSFENLNKYLESAVYYCNEIKNLTNQVIQDSVTKEVQQAIESNSRFL